MSYWLLRPHAILVLSIIASVNYGRTVSAQTTWLAEVVSTDLQLEFGAPLRLRVPISFRSPTVPVILAPFYYETVDDDGIEYRYIYRAGANDWQETGLPLQTTNHGAWVNLDHWCADAGAGCATVVHQDRNDVHYASMWYNDFPFPHWLWSERAPIHWCSCTNPAASPRCCQWDPEYCATPTANTSFVNLSGTYHAVWLGQNAEFEVNPDTIYYGSWSNGYNCLDIPVITVAEDVVFTVDQTAIAVDGVSVAIVTPPYFYLGTTSGDFTEEDLAEELGFTVPPQVEMHSPELAMGGGLVHLAFLKNDEVYYALREGTGWSLDLVDTMTAELPDEDKTIAVWIDAHNRPALAYYTGDKVKYAVKDEGTWNLEELENANTLSSRYGRGLSVDTAHGYPAIAYLDEDPDAGISVAPLVYDDEPESANVILDGCVERYTDILPLLSLSVLPDRLLLGASQEPEINECAQISFTINSSPTGQSVDWAVSIRKKGVSESAADCHISGSGSTTLSHSQQLSTACLAEIASLTSCTYPALCEYVVRLEATFTGQDCTYSIERTLVIDYLRVTKVSFNHSTSEKTDASTLWKINRDVPYAKTLEEIVAPEWTLGTQEADCSYAEDTNEAAMWVGLDESEYWLDTGAGPFKTLKVTVLSLVGSSGPVLFSLRGKSSTLPHTNYGFGIFSPGNREVAVSVPVFRESFFTTSVETYETFSGVYIWEANNLGDAGETSHNAVYYLPREASDLDFTTCTKPPTPVDKKWPWADVLEKVMPWVDHLAASDPPELIPTLLTRKVYDDAPWSYDTKSGFARLSFMHGNPALAQYANGIQLVDEFTGATPVAGNVNCNDMASLLSLLTHSIGVALEPFGVGRLTTTDPEFRPSVNVIALMDGTETNNPFFRLYETDPYNGLQPPIDDDCRCHKYNNHIFTSMSCHEGGPCDGMTEIYDALFRRRDNSDTLAETGDSEYDNVQNAPGSVSTDPPFAWNACSSLGLCTPPPGGIPMCAPCNSAPPTGQSCYLPCGNQIRALCAPLNCGAINEPSGGNTFDYVRGMAAADYIDRLFDGRPCPRMDPLVQVCDPVSTSTLAVPRVLPLQVCLENP